MIVANLQNSDGRLRIWLPYSGRYLIIDKTKRVSQLAIRHRLFNSIRKDQTVIKKKKVITRYFLTEKVMTK